MISLYTSRITPYGGYLKSPITTPTANENSITMRNITAILLVLILYQLRVINAIILWIINASNHFSPSSLYE